jgi:RNA polymerase sigma-70 factor (ECF subfamily)
MAMQLVDESRLVDAAQSGDSAAFSRLVKQYYGSIYRVTIKITNNPEDAEDALQDALTKAYCNLGRFQGHSRFYTWLTRIAMNEALLKLRKKRSDRYVPLDDVLRPGTPAEIQDPKDNPENRYVKLELGDNVSKALGSLTAPLRTTLLLREVEDLSVRETAEALGTSVAAVKSRLKRARSRLRHRLRWLTREIGPDDEPSELRAGPLPGRPG